MGLLGMPFPFILAMTAGLLNFMPYIGAIAGAVPAALIALSVGVEKTMFVTLLCLGAQTFEANVLVHRFNAALSIYHWRR